MERHYKVTAEIVVTKEEVLNYLGYSADSDYEPTDDEWEECADAIFCSMDLDYKITIL